MAERTRISCAGAIIPLDEIEKKYLKWLKIALGSLQNDAYYSQHFDEIFNIKYNHELYFRMCENVLEIIARHAAKHPKIIIGVTVSFDMRKRLTLDMPSKEKILSQLRKSEPPSIYLTLKDKITSAPDLTAGEEHTIYVHDNPYFPVPKFVYTSFLECRTQTDRQNNWEFSRFLKFECIP